MKTKNVNSMMIGSMVGVMMCAGLARADVHFDISPMVSAGKIVTGGVTHATMENPWTGESTAPASFNYYQPEMRVYGYELGEDALFPNASNDPGVNRAPGNYVVQDGSTVTLGGTGLPLGSQLRFTILSDLRAWNGANFAAVGGGETMTLSFGSNQRVAGTGTAAGTSVNPLAIKSFSANDNVHLHLTSSISSGAATGVYLLEAQLESSNPAVAASLPFWVVYNFGDTEENHEAAIAWVEGNVVPEPAALSLLLIGGAGMALGRRTRSR